MYKTDFAQIACIYFLLRAVAVFEFNNQQYENEKKNKNRNINS